MMVLGLLGTTSSVKQKMGICLRGHTSLLEQEPQAPRETDGATSAKHSAEQTVPYTEASNCN